MFRLISIITALVLLTIYIAQNLTEMMVIRFLIFKFEIPSVVSIFLFMSIGACLTLPMFFKYRKAVKKSSEKAVKNKKKKKQEEKTAEDVKPS